MRMLSQLLHSLSVENLTSWNSSWWSVVVVCCLSVNLFSFPIRVLSATPRPSLSLIYFLYANKNFGPQGYFLVIQGISMGNVKEIIQVGGEGNLFHYLHCWTSILVLFQWTPLFVQFLYLHLTMLTILCRYSSLLSEFFNSVVTDADDCCVTAFI